MNEKDLNTLLSKFYNGDTTPAEEQLLRDNLPGDSLDKVLLDSLNELAQESFKVPDHLEQTLSESIDSWQQHEDATTSTTLMWWRRGAWWAVAASVAIAIATGWWFMRNDNQASTGTNQQQLTAQVDTQAQELPVVQEAVSVPQVVEKEVVAQAVMNAATQKSRHNRASRQHAVARQVSHLAKNDDNHALTATEERMALEALEKFATTLDKGIASLDNAGETMQELDNTIQKHLIID